MNSNSNFNSNLISEQPIIMYIVINDELGMSPGKIASQCAHVVQIIVDELVSETYESMSSSKECLDYAKWKHNPVKIILKARGSRFYELIKECNARSFMDSGKTTQNTSSHTTAIGFLPSSITQDLLKGYDLLA